MATLTDLQAAIANQGTEISNLATAVNAANALLATLHTEVTNPVAMQSALDALNANTAALSILKNDSTTAVATNTPA